MDDKLLGRAVEYHGPDFLRQLQLEQQNMPPNIFLHLQRHRPHNPEIDDPQFVLNVRRFISKKADMLFQPASGKTKKNINPVDDDEDCFAKMPPLETFMGIDPNTCRRHFFTSLKTRNVVIGIVTSILDSGLVLQLLCMDDDKNRDIDALRIAAFVPVKEIPKMFPTQNPTEGYQVQDFIRGVVVNVNLESESILVSLSDRELEHREGTPPHLGLIQEEDFPVQYRRKLHIRGLTFDELLNSIMGFRNPGNVKYLLQSLSQAEEFSMMRGLHSLKIPEKEYADSLRKQQSQKMAYKNVASGIAFFKEGNLVAAMQQLNKALQIDTKNVEALVARGALYANRESYERAIEDFEEALHVNRKHPNAIKYMHETLLAKGRGLEDEGDWDEAEACYNKALALQPDSQEAKESIKYVQYRKESGPGKGKGEKPYDEKSKSPSYQSTTDTLKKLIQVDQKKKKVESDGKSEKRRRSRKYSSSSSSSSSSSDSGSRSSRSPRRRSHERKSRSPSPKRSRDYKEERFYKSSDQRLSEDTSGRHQRAQDVQSQHYSFFKKDERIPFLDTSPVHDAESHCSVAVGKPDGPVDEEDDDLYGDSKYDKPDRHVLASGDQKPSSSYQNEPKPFIKGEHSSYQNEPKPGTHKGEVARDVKPQVKERSVTPTKDEINDRLGLEDISPDVHEDRKTDDVKYRSGRNHRKGKRALHISKPWSPDDKKYEARESRKSRHSTDYDGQSPDRHGHSETRDKFESDRRKDPYEKETPGKYGDSSGYEKQNESFEERRIISVGKINSKEESKRRIDNDYKREKHQRSSERSSSQTGEPQERRSIVLSKKQKRPDSNEHKEMEYISHIFAEQPKKERRRRSSSYHSRSRSHSSHRSRSRSRSGRRRSRSGSDRRSRSRSDRRRSRSRSSRRSRSRSRKRSRSRSRRTRSRSRSESRSRSMKSRYGTISPKGHTDVERRRSKDGERSYVREIEGPSRSSKEGPYGRSLESQDQGRQNPDNMRKDDGSQAQHRDELSGKEMLSMRGVKINPKYKKRYREDNESYQSRDQDEKKKTDLTDIFADLQAPEARKSSKLNIAFPAYIPRAVKLKQYQAPEVSLNPESRPPPQSVQPVMPPNRQTNVTEIKDQQVFISSGSVYEDYERLRPNERSVKQRKRQDSHSRSPDERRSEKSHKYGRHSKSRSRSPEGRRSEKSHKNGRRSKSRSRSPDERRKVKTSKSDYRRSRSSSHSRGRTPQRKSDKYKKRSTSRSRSPENRKSEKSVKYRKYSRSKSRSRSPSDRRKESRSKRDSRSHSRDRSPNQKLDKKSGKYYKKSRSRSKSKETKAKGKTSPNRTGRNIFMTAAFKRNKSRSKSPSTEGYKKRSDKGSHRGLRSRSRSTSHDREKPKEVAVRNVEIKRTIQVADIPTVKSKWDSPEEKSTRWEDTRSGGHSLEMPLTLSNVYYQGDVGKLISSSPPPHRRMKPEEKKKLLEKWKELDTQDERTESQTDSINPDDIKSSKMFESKVREIEKQLMGSSKKTEDEDTDRKGKSKKKAKVKGMKSKWDTDSDSSGSRKGQRSSSSDSLRSRSRDSKRKSLSKKSLRGKEDALPDVVKSVKKDNQRVFWFHKDKVIAGKNFKGKPYKKKSRSRSPKRKRSRSRSPKRKRSRSKSPHSSSFHKKGLKADINKNPFNTKPKDDETTPKKLLLVQKPQDKQYDSLKEMEGFLQKLKTEKKKKDEGPSTVKK